MARMARAASPSSIVAGLLRHDPARRQHLKAWAGRVARRLRRLGLNVDACRVGDDGVDFDADGRLGLTVGPETVAVALAVPATDLPRVRERLAEPARTAALMAAVGALPEQFELGTSGDPRRVAASRVTDHELRALFDRAAQEQLCVWLGWSVPRAVVAAHAPTIDEQLEDALAALGSVLLLLGRSAGADARRGPRGRHEPHEAKVPERRSPEDASGGGREHRRLRAVDPEVPPQAGRQPEGRTRREVPPQAGRQPEGRARRDAELDPFDCASDAPSEHDANHPASMAPLPPRRPLRTNGRRASSVRVEKGAKVRVLEGPFAGKVGVVHELDGKGGARILLGLLAVRVEVKDLGGADEGRGRVRLGSSHRKPLPARS